MGNLRPLFALDSMHQCLWGLHKDGWKGECSHGLVWFITHHWTQLSVLAQVLCIVHIKYNAQLSGVLGLH